MATKIQHREPEPVAHPVLIKTLEEGIERSNTEHTVETPLVLVTLADHDSSPPDPDDANGSRLHTYPKSPSNEPLTHDVEALDMHAPVQDANVLDREHLHGVVGDTDPLPSSSSWHQQATKRHRSYRRHQRKTEAR